MSVPSDYNVARDLAPAVDSPKQSVVLEHPVNDEKEVDDNDDDLNMILMASLAEHNMRSNQPMGNKSTKVPRKFNFKTKSSMSTLN